MLPGSSDICSEVALGSRQIAAATGIPGRLRPLCQGPGEGAPCPRQTVPPQKHLRPQRVHQTKPTSSGSVFTCIALMLRLHVRHGQQSPSPLHFVKLSPFFFVFLSKQYFFLLSQAQKFNAIVI